VAQFPWSELAGVLSTIRIIAESTTNKLAKAVLKDIANEERIHAGEFLMLLFELAPDEKTLYAKGAKEVDAMKSQLQKNRK
jgi:rubrerythrin